MALRVLLPAEFQEQHQRITLEYLQRGHDLNRQEWSQAIAAFDLLNDALVLSSAGLLPFPVIYRQHVEDRYADAFIERLYTARQVDRESVVIWAGIARQIAVDLAQAGLYQSDVSGTRLLLSYCLYWWRAFTLGYAFEVEIQRDLAQSGIKFTAHDLRRRENRLTPYDIAVLGFKGDIKTSVYFLQASRSRSLAHDFYITRVYGRERVRTLVVFMQATMWQAIDGDTLLVLLEEIADTLPHAARIRHQGIELTVIDYETWKQKIRRRQAAGPTKKESEW
jgi:hypothetical protein